MPFTRSFAPLLIALITFTPGAALAEALCDCNRDCQSRSNPSEGLSFDDEEHRLWYEGRFWAGECPDGLSWCFSGDDWYDVMEETLEKTEPAEQAALCPRLFNLGQRIGHEWARDNDIRRIDTDDLDDWSDILLDAEDSVGATSEIESLTSSRLD